jgi:hypothetical protein
LLASPLTRLGNVIATNRYPHAIALCCIPAKPYPTDHPYRMPGRAANAVANHRAIEQVLFGWPKTAKQHNALAVVLTVIVSNVQTQLAITHELRHQRAGRLGADGLGAVVADCVTIHINDDAVVRRAKSPGDGHATSSARLNGVIDDPGMHGHAVRFIKEHHQRQASGKGTLHGVAIDHEAIGHTTFPLHKNVMALSASGWTWCHQAELLGAVIAKMIVQYHSFLWSRK